MTGFFFVFSAFEWAELKTARAEGNFPVQQEIISSRQNVTADPNRGWDKWGRRPWRSIF